MGPLPWDPGSSSDLSYAVACRMNAGRRASVETVLGDQELREIEASERFTYCDSSFMVGLQARIQIFELVMETHEPRRLLTKPTITGRCVPFAFLGLDQCRVPDYVPTLHWKLTGKSKVILSQARTACGVGSMKFGWKGDIQDFRTVHLRF